MLGNRKKKKKTFPTVSFVTSVQEARSLFQKFRHPHVCVPQDSAGSLGTFPLKAFLFVFIKNDYQDNENSWTWAYLTQALLALVCWMTEGLSIAEQSAIVCTEVTGRAALAQGPRWVGTSQVLAWLRLTDHHPTLSQLQTIAGRILTGKTVILRKLAFCSFL